MDINPNSSGKSSPTNSQVSEPAARRLIDRLNSQGSQGNTEQVSISYKAQKLDLIRAEFFSTTIRSDQIPALTQRLFEDGLIDSEQLQSLSGFRSTPVSAVSESVHFLNNFILNESVDGDTEGAKSLLSALEVIEQMNAPATAGRREQEQQALVFVGNYTEMLKETDAPADIIKGFEKVSEVLVTLNKVRSNEAKTGALASYASVEEAHKALYDDKPKQGNDSV